MSGKQGNDSLRKSFHTQTSGGQLTSSGHDKRSIVVIVELKMTSLDGC